MKRRTKKLLTLAVSTVLAIGCGEFLLRASGRTATMDERVLGEYQSRWGRRADSRLKAHPPRHTFEMPTADYVHHATTNGEGLRDVDHPVEKPDGERRIVALGDSFTEGVGADVAGSWPRVLQSLLAGRTRVFNGGVAGSDPWFALELLKARLLKYRPDIVILAIDETDVSDVMFWGGAERFGSDGTTTGRPGPWFEPAYRRSHLIRGLVHLCGYDDRLLSPTDAKARETRALEQLDEAVLRFGKLADEHGFRFIAVLIPTPVEIREKLPMAIGKLAATPGSRANGVTGVVNLAGPVRERIPVAELETYAWPVDGHYKADGYRVLAEVIAAALRERGLVRK